MRISIGSENETKYRAIEEVCDEIRWSEIVQQCQKRKVKEVTTHNAWDEKTIQKRALERALEAYQEGDAYSIGIEEGFAKVAMTQTRYYTLCVAAITNGDRFTLGWSPGVTVPQKITDALREGEELPRILQIERLITGEEVPQDGLVSILSHAEAQRKEHMKIALRMALYPWRFRNKYA